MIIKQCDLCKKNVSVLSTLNDEFKTWDIKEICSYCLGKVDKIISNERTKYLDSRANKVKKFFKDNIKES